MTCPGEKEPAYIDAMAQPFVDGLNGVDVVELTAQTANLKPWMRPFATQIFVRKALEGVDWESTGLLPQDEPGGDTLTPHDTAMRLMAFAYGDAMALLQVGIGYLSDLERLIPQSLDHQTVLHESAKRILMPAGLDDIHKNAVLRLLKAHVLHDEDEIKALRYHKHTAPYVKEPLHIDEKGLLAWHPRVHSWMVEKAAVLKGCPAHREIVELNGRKMPLTHFVWHKFVDYAFAA